jgi:plastocyanin
MMDTRGQKMRGALAGAFLLGAAVAALALVSGWVPAREAAAADTSDATISIDNFTFTPERVTVKAGTTVTWRNKDDIPHAVASSTRLFKSKTLDTDDAYTFTFLTPGTFDYFCSLHPHMTGTIIVEGQVTQ